MVNLESRCIVGSDPNNRRHERDFYPTPREVTAALLDFLEKQNFLCKKETIWECACGDYAMSSVMEERGYDVLPTDIIYGHDFLAVKPPVNMVDWIITNPPFNIAEQFIRHAAEFHKPFAFLLKSQYWHSSKRLKLFREFPPTFILPLTWRPDFTGEGNSLMDMIWCVWCGDKTTQYIPLERCKNDK